MNKHECIPMQLYLQKQASSQTWLTGCSLLVPVPAYEETGGLSEMTHSKNGLIIDLFSWKPNVLLERWTADLVMKQLGCLNRWSPGKGMRNSA